MSKSLNWQQQEGQLILSGELNRETVLTLWQHRTQLSPVTLIDVSELVRVDSAGLALLIHLLGNQMPSAKLTGVNKNLNTLITLYNLNQVINYD